MSSTTRRSRWSAAIHGTALGGGLETALACHFRVAVGSARFGLPEVKLGLCPGAGGTQRLPRVVGPEKALEMIAGGNPIGAREAAAHGLADEIVEGDLTEGAIAFARRAVGRGGARFVRIRDRDDKVAPARGSSTLFDDFRKKRARRMRGFEAPEACIRTVEAAVELPFDQGMDREQEIFGQLMGGVQARAQQYFFFSEREAAKIPDIPRGTETIDVKRAVVVGGGTMGGGISMCFANAGIPVSMVEMSREALDRGLATIRRNYENTAARGGFTSEQVEERVGLISGTVDLEAAREADVVVEAVYEELEVKQETFRRLDALAPGHALLASNTSALDVNAIAAVTGRPESVIGTHFFSPANIMRLVEVVRGEKSANETVATAMALSRRPREGAGAGRGVATASSGTECSSPASARRTGSSSRARRRMRSTPCSTTSGSPWGPFRDGRSRGDSTSGGTRRRPPDRRSASAFARPAGAGRRRGPATTTTSREAGSRSPRRSSKAPSGSSPRSASSGAATTSDATRSSSVSSTR